MKFILKTLSVVTVLIASTGAILAQLPPPGGGGPANVPIDGGVFTLVGATIAYGAKKIYDRKKAERE